MRSFVLIFALHHFADAFSSQSLHSLKNIKCAASYPQRGLLRVVTTMQSSHKSENTGSNGIDEWVSRSSLKAQQLEATMKLKVDVFTSEYATLIGQNGQKVSPDKLKGTSVALYFAMANCEACEEFTPLLKSYFNTHNSISDDPKINIVFVSSDPDEECAMKHFRSMDPEWLMLNYSCNFRQESKRRYGIWGASEASIFGTSIAALRERKGGLPGVMVIQADGEPVAHLDAEARGVEALLAWDPRHHAWP